MTVSLPDGVTVVEQWAVWSEDGQIYRVADNARDVAEREVARLRAEEPRAAVAHQFVMVTPHGETKSGWRWTPGGEGCCG